MRLIDVDALGIGKAKREAFVAPEYADGWNSAIEIINNAPTITPDSLVKRGRWTRGDMPTYGGYKCSVCGGNTVHYKAKFCPSCGALMED